MSVLPNGSAVGVRLSEGFDIGPPSGFVEQVTENFDINPPSGFTSQVTEDFDINPPPVAEQLITANPVEVEVGNGVRIEGTLSADGLDPEGIDVDLIIDSSIEETKTTDSDGKVLFDRVFNTIGTFTIELEAAVTAIEVQLKEDFE